jgi:hypothetical protein
MKVDLSLLWDAVRRMQAEIVDFDTGLDWDPFEAQIDDQLSRSEGMSIPIGELESTDGLLSYRGRQVLLFIPDHTYKTVSKVLRNPKEGNKFHVSDCSTLEGMKRNNRFEERYRVTNNLSGEFEIWGDNRGTIEEGVVRLNVCQNCLKKLNYKGASSTPGSASRLAQIFRIDEFFLTYSTLFRSLPKNIADDAKKGYTDDWALISKQARQQANYTCSSCHVNLTEEKRLVHTHHINGNKSDNSPENLLVLCADCHRKEPHHGHVYINLEDVRLINEFRKQQGILNDNNWEKVLKFADSAVVGVILHCKKGGMRPPEVGYEIPDVSGRVWAQLELAWPREKEGVYIGEKPEVDGWILRSIEEAIQYYE